MQNFVPPDGDNLLLIALARTGDLFRENGAARNLVVIELLIRLVLVATAPPLAEVAAKIPEREHDRVRVEQLRAQVHIGHVHGEQRELARAAAELVRRDLGKIETGRDGLEGHALRPCFFDRERLRRREAARDGDAIRLPVFKIAGETNNCRLDHRRQNDFLVFRHGENRDPAAEVFRLHAVWKPFRESQCDVFFLVDLIYRHGTPDRERRDVAQFQFAAGHEADFGVGRRQTLRHDEPPAVADGKRLRGGHREKILRAFKRLRPGCGTVFFQRGDALFFLEPLPPCEQRTVGGVVSGKVSFRRSGANFGGDFCTRCILKKDELRRLIGCHVRVEKHLDFRFRRHVGSVLEIVWPEAAHAHRRRVDGATQLRLQRLPIGIRETGPKRDPITRAERHRLGGREHAAALTEPDERALRSRMKHDWRLLRLFADFRPGRDRLVEANLERGRRCEFVGFQDELRAGFRAVVGRALKCECAERGEKGESF